MTNNMLQPRKKREPLLRKHSEEDPYPTLMVSLDENPSPNSFYEISILDINVTGMGITSPVPLTIGQPLFFGANRHEWGLPPSGIVMWTFQDNDGHRAGIKFA